MADTTKDPSYYTRGGPGYRQQLDDLMQDRPRSLQEVRPMEPDGDEGGAEPGPGTGPYLKRRQRDYDQNDAEK